MGLFRPYEQGTSKKTGPTEETVEAGPGSSTDVLLFLGYHSSQTRSEDLVNRQKTTG